jgi:hypothetical protein
MVDEATSDKEGGESGLVHVPGGGPQIKPIKVLHRHDGYISFMVWSGDEIARRFAIRANALDEMFPEFTAQLIRDSFVSINAGYTLQDRSGHAAGPALHRTEFMRYLSACYADLDYYDHDLSRPRVIYELERMWAAGELPRASMLVDSGHGLWLLWLLHDASRPSQAHRGAFADNPFDHLQLYTKTNKAIYAKLAHLGADPIHDATRHIRVPGSFRNDRETFVQWDVKGTGGSVNSYTLKQLAALVGVQTVPRPQAERRALESTQRKPGSQSRAWIKTNENRLAALGILRDLRGGGFQQGIRNRAAYFYALALRGVNTRPAEIYEAIFDMGAHCQPPLSPGECTRAVKQALKAKTVKLSYRTIAECLDVDPHEAEVITQALYGNVRSGDHRFFPAAARFGDLQPTTTNTGGEFRATKKVRREEYIQQIVRENGWVPPIREMARQLEARGVYASIGTLHADYKKLGLVSAEGARRERMRHSEQLSFLGPAATAPDQADFTFGAVG